MGKAVWKEIPGHPGYRVSDRGEVMGLSGNILKACLHRPGGYYKLRLRRGNQFYVHRLVMLAFVGPCPEGYEVDHDDFDRANNALTNLLYRLKSVNNNRWKSRQPGEDDRYDDVDFNDLPEPEGEPLPSF